jgi:hypothetical protein
LISRPFLSLTSSGNRLLNWTEFVLVVSETAALYSVLESIDANRHAGVALKVFQSTSQQEVEPAIFVVRFWRQDMSVGD